MPDFLSMKISEIFPHETAKDYALRVLKENIITLELAPGSQISENELSAALSISRTPIREALSELAKVKLIEIIPQKKTSIALIDSRLVEEAGFMRYTMESAVIEQVCLQRTEEDLLRFEENIALQKVYFQNNASEKMLQKDDEFHRAFFEITRNMEIYQLMQNLQIHFDRVRSISLSSLHNLQIIEDHEAIVESIKKRDAEEAKKLLQQHLSRYLVDEASIKARFPDYFLQQAD